jgi:hypothetical protein
MNSLVIGRQDKMEALGRSATIETIDGILEHYPDIYDRIDIENGFRTKKYDYGLYIDRQAKRTHDEVKAYREREERKWFWILALTSPLWLAALVYGVYVFGNEIKNYPLQVCAVCGILIALKVLGGKS